MVTREASGVHAGAPRVERESTLAHDDGSIRPWPHFDADELEALAETHEPRTAGGQEAWLPKEAGDGDD